MKEGPVFFLKRQGGNKKKPMHYSEFGGWDMVVGILKIRRKVCALAKESAAAHCTSDSCPGRREQKGCHPSVPFAMEPLQETGLTCN